MFCPCACCECLDINVCKVLLTRLTTEGSAMRPGMARSLFSSSNLAHSPHHTVLTAVLSHLVVCQDVYSLRSRCDALPSIPAVPLLQIPRNPSHFSVNRPTHRTTRHCSTTPRVRTSFGRNLGVTLVSVVRVTNFYLYIDVYTNIYHQLYV